jgi:hypothetical protein
MDLIQQTNDNSHAACCHCCIYCNQGTHTNANEFASTGFSNSVCSVIIHATSACGQPAKLVSGVFAINLNFLTETPAGEIRADPLHIGRLPECVQHTI